MELLQEIFQLCVIPLLGVLTTYVVKYIQTRSEQIEKSQENVLADKYIKMLSNTIVDCVRATNQTYVEALKNKNAFDMKAQEEAFQRTSLAISSILSEEAKEYLNSIYGDLNAYIANEIEAQVNLLK